MVPESEDQNKHRLGASDEDLTIEELIAKRQSISDKSFIAAVKIIAELRRAQDL